MKSISRSSCESLRRESLSVIELNSPVVVLRARIGRRRNDDGSGPAGQYGACRRPGRTPPSKFDAKKRAAESRGSKV
jgi:hypothetical protein